MIGYTIITNKSKKSKNAISGNNAMDEGNKNNK